MTSNTKYEECKTVRARFRRRRRPGGHDGCPRDDRQTVDAEKPVLYL
jgi:hypothetical protein